MSDSKRSGTQWVYLVFLGIVIFVFVFFPLFGGAWRMKFSVAFSKAFYVIGTLMTFGGILLIFGGILCFITKRPLIGVFSLILGVVLLGFAGYFLSPATGGGTGGASKEPSGYH